MRGIFALVGFLLLSRGRPRVDAQQAQKACEAVRSGQMSLRAAAKAYGIGRTALHDRVRCLVDVDARVGPGTILSKEEERFDRRCLDLRFSTLFAVGLEGAARRCAEELEYAP
ncbi:unnamed protein product [Scytosiphon promiscuus]